MNDIDQQIENLVHDFDDASIDDLSQYLAECLGCNPTFCKSRIQRFIDRQVWYGALTGE